MKEYLEEDPIIIEKGRGLYLYDLQGRRYFDGVSSLWVNTIGHNHPVLKKALKTQIDCLIHSTFLGLSHPPGILLAERLARITPSPLKRVFYSDNGSTACEIALKMAFQFFRQNGEPQRDTFVTLKEAYHGDTIGSVSLGGIDLFHKIYRPLLFKTEKIPTPYCYRCPLKLKYPSCGIACLDSLEKLAQKKKEKIIGVFLEPLVQGAAGMLVQPPGYLKRLDEIAKGAGWLLIVDEVATGFGRTGTLFAVEQEEVRPDLMALAKSITGGTIPLAVTMTTEEIFNGFLGSFGSCRTFYHGHTYTGNPLACSVSLAHLDYLKKNRIVESVAHLARKWAPLLKGLEELRWVGEVRQRGFMVGIELVKDKKRKTPFPYGEKIGYRVCEKMIEKGIWLRPLGNVIVLMPPLVTPFKILEEIVEKLRESIEEVLGN